MDLPIMSPSDIQDAAHSMNDIKHKNRELWQISIMLGEGVGTGHTM
jgi:hypothetical protein